MYCSTIITTKSHHLVYTFITLLAATVSVAGADKSTIGRQQRMLSTLGNVVVEKNIQGIWRAVLWLPLPFLQP